MAKPQDQRNDAPGGPDAFDVHSVYFENGTDVEFGILNIASGGIVVLDDNVATVRDHYIIQITDESQQNFNNTGGLRITGATSLDVCDFGSYGTVEVAGEDVGDEFSGFADNFELPRLMIGPAAKVALVDEYDNGNRDGIGGFDEALYVDTLEFVDTSGVLDLNGLHLYAKGVGGDGRIVDSASTTDCNTNSINDACDILTGTSTDCNATLIPDECEPIGNGDFDADGAVGLDDFHVFGGCLAGPGLLPTPPSPECLDACLAAFDFAPADGDIDVADFAALQCLFSGGQP